MFHSGVDICAIIADIGSHTTRIGLAGEDSPRAIFKTAVGTTGSSSEGNEKRKIHHNPEIFEENMSIDVCVRDGLVTDFDLYEDVWNRAMAESFAGVSLRECSVLLTEKIYNPSSVRHKTAELMMEKMGCNGLFLARDAALACYSIGKTTGISVDIGSSGTVISPVLDGWVDPKGLNRGIVGGQAMDAHLYSLLSAPRGGGGAAMVPSFALLKGGKGKGKGVTASYDAWARLDLARDIKERVCSTSEMALQDGDNDDDDDGDGDDESGKSTYTLPDGTTVTLGRKERCSTTELLFNPSPLVAQDTLLSALRFPASLAPAAKRESTPQLVYNSVLRSDPETHAALFDCIVVTGGASATPGVPQRLGREMASLVPGASVRVMSAADEDRPLGPLLGASIIASLTSVQEMWVSKKDYDEHGASIVDRKCP